MNPRKFLALLLLASSAAATACTDTALAPLDPGRAEAGRRTAGGLFDVRVLQRETPLAEPLSATARIGLKGGKLRLDEAGLRVDIPRGALDLEGDETVEITVTALAGGRVAYEFEPHGLVFRRPIELRQDTRVTTTPSKGFQQVRGAYFADAAQLGESTATVSEFRPTSFDSKGWRITWTVEHFSGYLLSID